MMPQPAAGLVAARSYALALLFGALALPAAAEITYTADGYRSAGDHRHDPALERRTYLGAGARRDQNAQNRRYRGLSQRHPDSRDEYHGARRSHTPHVRDDHRAGQFDDPRHGYSGRSHDDNRGSGSNRRYDAAPGYGINGYRGSQHDRGNAPGYRYGNGRRGETHFDHPSLQRGPSVPQPLRRYRDRR